ncbi:MAG: S8 family serine peptidase [Salibacteraceae bacterium]
MSKFITLLFIAFSGAIFGQVSDTNQQIELQQLYLQFRAKEIKDSIQISEIVKRSNLKQHELDGGSTIGFVGFEPNGFPIFYATDNSNAAATVGTNLVVAGAINGYGLTGNGMVIGEWDGGEVLTTHVELTGRVSQIDSPSDTSNHATHVAGTMIAAGIDASAKGMATAATIRAHDFYSDDSEMTTFASTGRISNHSYGRITGWREMNNGDWRWYGDTSISGVEDYMFGFYSSNARSWDLIANAAPNYLIVKSAGNDRNDVPPASVTSHFVQAGFQNWVVSTVSRPQDGGTDGYDCISSSGNAKNILTVGAVSDIPGGWTQPSDVNMSSFSGWGPTDDGRIKPDIVANGVSLYSTGKDNNTDYYTSSGTSMSAPNATGSMALLQEMYNDSNSSFMTASSLKALVIHTANEAGLTGPDFKFGWGLLNIKGAADVIADTAQNKIIEATLAQNVTDTYTFYADGTTDVEATIVWNDPAHSIPTASLDPSTSMLVNDLDLRISDANGTIKLPWTPNSATPSVAATTGDNVKDNVEKVVFANPTMGTYTFTVSHKGSIGAGQDYSLIITGVQSAPAAPAPTPSFTSTNTSICEGDSVYFTDTSTGNPTSLSWVFAGGNPSTSTSSNPAIGYSTAGNYTVKLFATNANGTDSLIQTNFVTVSAPPTVAITPFTDVCVSAGNQTLSGGSPAGGTWSGTAVNNGLFDPMGAGLGTHTLTYTVISGACTASTTANINVVLPPNPSFPPFPSSFCDNSAAFLLSGATPIGGTYSGTGVVNNVFDPAVAGVGSHFITYSYTDPSGCSGDSTISVNVIPGTATSIGAFSDICESAPVLTLTGGTPAGGYYTGPGVDTMAGTFDPSLAGAGSHSITYFGSGGLCISASSANITVIAAPTVSLDPILDECLSNTSLLLTGGLPTGGLFSGTGVNNGVFNASVAGLGTHMIYYSYTDVTTTCSAIDSTPVNVVNSIQYSINDTTLCENSSSFTMVGYPSGGVFSGAGVTGNIFDPTAAGFGVHTINYTDPTNSCASIATATFTVNALPVVTLDPFNSICLTGGNVNLTGGLPIGGTYSGLGITNNILDPLLIGIGTVDITYTYTDMGCTNSAMQTAVIGMGSPEITNISNAYCVNESSVIFVGNPAGGTYSGSGITDSIFDPNAAGVGTHAITYTTTGGCAGTTNYTVQVNPKPIIGSVSGPLISSQNIVAGYMVNAQNGAYYDWLATGGVIVTNSNNQITVNWGANSTGTLEVAIFDQNGCSDTTSITVDLWPVGVDELNNNSEVHFYPNPVKETINFETTLTEDADLELVVLNALGQKVFTRNKMAVKGRINWSVNASEWSNGTYFFVLQSKQGVLSKGQFLKQ